MSVFECNGHSTVFPKSRTFRASDSGGASPELDGAFVEQAGAGSLGGMLVLAGGIADIAIGIGIAVRRTSRLALWAAFGVSLFYLIAATLTLPLLWTDPLGPLMKVAPILVLNLVALAILEDR